MSKSTPSFSRHELEAVLPQWRLKPLFTRAAGGTANASLVVVTPRGQYVLRRRNPRYSDLGQLNFDHSVLHALARRGLPVPHVVKTLSGSRWLSHEGHVYELHQFIDGQEADPNSLEEVSAAGAMLARFHRATENLQPAGAKDWPRYFDPKVSLKSLKEAQRQLRLGLPGDLSPYTADQVATTLEALRAAAQACDRALPDKHYWALPQCLIHGDWHPANLRFAHHEVVGILDFDWVGRQPRMVDVTDGLMFFGSVRETDLDGGDIWSLTQPYRFVWERMAAFFAAYTATVHLEPRELAALPHLMRQRALYNRVDPMVRKVPTDRRLAFLVAGRVEEPLAWIAEHETALAHGF